MVCSYGAYVYSVCMILMHCVHIYIARSVCTHVPLCGGYAYGLFMWDVCMVCSHAVCVCVCEGCLTILAGVSDRICQRSSLSLHLQSLWEQVSRDRRQTLWAEEPILFPLGGRMMFSQWLHNSSNQGSSRLSAVCTARISHLSFVFQLFFLYRALIYF